MGSAINRGLTFHMAQTPVQRYGCIKVVLTPNA